MSYRMQKLEQCCVCKDILVMGAWIKRPIGVTGKFKTVYCPLCKDLTVTKDYVKTKRKEAYNVGRKVALV